MSDDFGVKQFYHRNLNFFMIFGENFKIFEIICRIYNYFNGKIFKDLNVLSFTRSFVVILVRKMKITINCNLCVWYR